MKCALFKPWIFLLIVVVSAAACSGVKADPAKSISSTATTPRGPDGKPDVTGVWGRAGQGGTAGQKATASDNAVQSAFYTRTGGLYALEIDGSVMRKGERNKPMYRPEYWEKVRTLRKNVLKDDPDFQCMPEGVPRMGPPQEILRQGNRIALLYSNFNGAGTPKPYYRVVRLDRPHDTERAQQQTFRGDSVGHWEGDTLVVDTVGFNDETWITSRNGYFHSTDMRVLERFTRNGDSMKYQVTVEDPTVLLEPWVWEPQQLTLNKNPDAMLEEDYPCSERDAPYVQVP